jgi:hypothetical protein
MRQPFNVNDRLVSVADRGARIVVIVTGYAADGKVLVKWDSHDCPMAMAVASVEKPGDRKDEPRFRPESWDLAEEQSLAEYIGRVESDIAKRSNTK